MTVSGRDKGFVYIFARMKLTKVFYISDRLSQDVRQAAALQWMEALDWAGGAKESNLQVGTGQSRMLGHRMYRGRFREPSTTVSSFLQKCRIKITNVLKNPLYFLLLARPRLLM